MTREDPRQRVSLMGPSTVEEVLCASKGTGLFSRLMQLAVGLAMGTNGIEVIVLSYLIPCVVVDWDLTTLQEESLTASVFAGELVGAMVLGVVSDMYGRRLGFLLATLLVVVFGLLTVVASSFWWLLLFRGMVGVGVAGMEVPFDLLSEVVPRKNKPRILMGVQVTWAVGSLFIGLMAWVILGFGFSWRWLALIAAIPSLTVLMCFSYIPESPRWLIAQGRLKDAKDVLKKIAWSNGIELTDFVLIPEEESQGGESGLWDLWNRPEIRTRCFTACVVWGAYGFLYYGVILLSVKVLGTEEACSFDYGVLSFAASSELVASAITALYMHMLDRRVILTLNFCLSAVTSLALTIFTSEVWLLVTSFTARGTAYIAIVFAWLVTPDLFPTEIRSTGHAVCYLVAQLGSIGASFWVDSNVPYKELAALIMVIGIVGGVAAQMLPAVRSLEGHGGQHNAATESMPLLSENGKSRLDTSEVIAAAPFL